MTYLLCLLAAMALGGAGWAIRRSSAMLGQTMMIVGCVGLAACLVWQVRVTMFQPEPAAPDRGQAVVGYYLAQQVLRELGNQPGRVLIVLPPVNVVDEETAEVYAGTFSRVLRPFPGFKIERTTLEKSGKPGPVTLKELQEALEAGSPALACVSFAGVPAEIENFQSADPSGAPAFFVFDPWGTTHWLKALKNGQVRAVVVPRPGVSRENSVRISGEPAAVFEQLYLLVTPANADQAAAQLRNKL